MSNAQAWVCALRRAAHRAPQLLGRTLRRGRVRYHMEKLEQAAAIIGEYKPDVVLDLGAGCGPFSPPTRTGPLQGAALHRCALGTHVAVHTHCVHPLVLVRAPDLAPHPRYWVLAHSLLKTQVNSFSAFTRWALSRLLPARMRASSAWPGVPPF